MVTSSMRSSAKEYIGNKAWLRLFAAGSMCNNSSFNGDTHNTRPCMYIKRADAGMIHHAAAHPMHMHGWHHLLPSLHSTPHIHI